MPLIVVEGIDGTGKSTLVRNLYDRLRQANWDVVVLREPGGYPGGEAIRALIEQSKNEVERCLLFLASRAGLAPYLRAHLGTPKKIVILDRWTPSTMAYQGQRIAPELLREMDRLARQSVQSDLVLWLDAPVDVCLERLKNKPDDLPDYELGDVLGAAQLNYRKMFDYDQVHDRKWKLLDATLPESEILEEAVNKIQVLIITGQLNPHLVKRT